MIVLRWAIFLGLAVSALLIVGCGSPAVTVSGKLLKNGQPMTVSADTYVTLSFIPDPTPSDDKAKSYNANFDQKTGSYTVELPPGKYRTKLIIVPPKDPSNKRPSGPGRPIDSKEAYDLNKSRELDIEVPAG